MAVLVYYRDQGGPHANTVFQAVLIAYESAETEFTWLPPTLHGSSAVMLYAGEAIANI